YLRALEGTPQSRIASELGVPAETVERWLEEAAAEARSGTLVDRTLAAHGEWFLGHEWLAEVTEDENGVFWVDLIAHASDERVTHYGSGPTAADALRRARERYEAEELGRS